MLDLESRPQKNLVDLFMADKVEKAKEKLRKDLEKAETYKKPETIEKYKKEANEAFRNAINPAAYNKKLSTDPDFAEVICVGIKPVDGEAQLYSLEEMEQFFKDNPDPTFVTYNGKKFDLPLIIKAGLKNGLDFPYKKLKDMCKKWNTNTHHDLMEIICDGEFKSLDLLLQIYLGISKKPINFETATEDEIKEHCLEDIVNTEKLYKIFIKII